MIMNQETIEKAARDYVMPNENIRSLMESIVAKEGFIAGADWRVNSVWHSPEEEPQADECIIVKKELFEGKYSYDCWKTGSGCAWDKDADYFCVTRWAYVSDLVPEGKEGGR